MRTVSWGQYCPAPSILAAGPLTPGPPAPQPGGLLIPSQEDQAVWEEG